MQVCPTAARKILIGLSAGHVRRLPLAGQRRGAAKGHRTRGHPLRGVRSPCSGRRCWPAAWAASHSEPAPHPVPPPARAAARPGTTPPRAATPGRCACSSSAGEWGLGRVPPLAALDSGRLPRWSHGGLAQGTRFVLRAGRVAPLRPGQISSQSDKSRATRRSVVPRPVPPGAAAQPRLRLANTGPGSTVCPCIINPSDTSRLPGHDSCLEYLVHHEATPRVPELLGCPLRH
jgi:hypothetical protein